MNEIAPSPGWQALIDHRRALAGRSLTALFAANPQRFAQLSLAWDDWLADWSKQRLTAETMALLVAYARERNLPAWIAAMFAGEKINLSEQRPALHTALRQQGDAPLAVDGADVIPAIRNEDVAACVHCHCVWIREARVRRITVGVSASAC